MQNTGRVRRPIYRFAGGPGLPPPKRAAKWLFGAAVAGAFALCLWWANGWQPLWEIFSDRKRPQVVVESAGPLSPIAYLFLLVAQTVVPPLPVPLVAMTGEYAFGISTGSVLYADLGIVTALGVTAYLYLRHRPNAVKEPARKRPESLS